MLNGSFGMGSESFNVSWMRHEGAPESRTNILSTIEVYKYDPARVHNVYNRGQVFCQIL